MKKTNEKRKSEAVNFQLSGIQLITFGAIFMALRVVLGFLEINIGDSYRITFSPLPVTLGAYMLGPIFGGIIGACGDIITLIIHPTGAINFGILFAKALWGVIMGLMLYKKPLTIARCIAANLIAIVLCNIIITTASLCIAYGYPLGAILPVRLVTNAILMPIYTFGTMFLGYAINNIYTKVSPRFAK